MIEIIHQVAFNAASLPLLLRRTIHLHRYYMFGEIIHAILSIILIRIYFLLTLPETDLVGNIDRTPVHYFVENLDWCLIHDKVEKTYWFSAAIEEDHGIGPFVWWGKPDGTLNVLVSLFFGLW